MGKAVDFEKIAPSDPDWENPVSVRDWRVWNFWKGMATPDYIELKKAQKDFFAEQFNRIAPVVRANFPAPKPDKKLTKSLATLIIEDAYDVYKIDEDFPQEVENILLKISFDEEDKKLKAKYVPKAKKIINKHGKTVLGQLTTKTTFELDNSRIVDFLKDQGGRFVSGINQTTRKMLGRQLALAAKGGEDSEDVYERLTRVFKGDLWDRRARKIARTEMITLTQWTRLEAAHQSGVVTKKRWICQLLPTSRNKPDGEDHVSMNGVEVGIDEPFEVQARKGVDKMYTPGDPNASAENIVDCLCVLDFPGTTAEFADIEGDKGLEEAQQIANDLKKDDDGLVKEDGVNRVTVNLNVEKMIQKANPAPAPQPAPIINVPPTDMQPVADAIDRLSDAVESGASRPPQKILVQNEIRVPKAPEQKRPVVNVENIIPQQIEKKQPDIKVIVQPKIESVLKMPKRKKTVHKEVHRDPRTQRVTGTTDTETEESVEEKGKD